MKNLNDTNTAEYISEMAFAKSLIGYKAQSTILTGISKNGQSTELLPADLITDCEVVFNFGEPMAMVTIDGNSVYTTTLRNIT